MGESILGNILFGARMEEERKRATEKNTGRKDDNGKTRYGLVPPRALDLVAQVLTYGGNRYGDDNWHVLFENDLDGSRARYLDATFRHIQAVRMGEELDPDSGLPHIAHAICSLLFILEIWSIQNTRD